MFIQGDINVANEPTICLPQPRLISDWEAALSLGSSLWDRIELFSVWFGLNEVNLRCDLMRLFRSGNLVVTFEDSHIIQFKRQVNPQSGHFVNIQMIISS